MAEPGLESTLQDSKALTLKQLAILSPHVQGSQEYSYFRILKAETEIRSKHFFSPEIALFI